MLVIYWEQSAFQDSRGYFYPGVVIKSLKNFEAVVCAYNMKYYFVAWFYVYISIFECLDKKIFYLTNKLKEMSKHITIAILIGQH